MSTDVKPRLTGIRWAVRGVLALAVAVSVAANILHAHPHPIAQAVAAWPPVALLLAVEVISRVPARRGRLATARLASAIGIAGIAAYISYGHMAAVAARYGEEGPAAWLLPLSVDGLIVVASLSLVELARHRTAPDPVDTPTVHNRRPGNTQPGTSTPPAPLASAIAVPAARTGPTPVHVPRPPRKENA